MFMHKFKRFSFEKRKEKQFAMQMDQFVEIISAIKQRFHRETEISDLLQTFEFAHRLNSLLDWIPFDREISLKL